MPFRNKKDREFLITIIHIETGQFIVAHFSCYRKCIVWYFGFHTTFQMICVGA